VRPLHVVRTRYGSGGLGDDPFCRRPESELLQRPIQPAGRDAEVGSVRSNVVDSVMLPGQYDMRLLQELHPFRQAEVRVRPLVDLVRD